MRFEFTNFGKLFQGRTFKSFVNLQKGQLCSRRCYGFAWSLDKTSEKRVRALFQSLVRMHRKVHEDLKVSIAVPFVAQGRTFTRSLSISNPIAHETINWQRTWLIAINATCCRDPSGAYSSSAIGLLTISGLDTGLAWGNHRLHSRMACSAATGSMKKNCRIGIGRA